MGIKDKENGFILKMDCSNMEEVVKNMYKHNLKGFSHETKESDAQYRKIFGKKSISKYKYVEPKGVDVISLHKIRFLEENIEAEIGTIFTVTNNKRLKYLLGDNKENVVYVDYVAGKITPTVKKIIDKNSKCMMLIEALCHYTDTEINRDIVVGEQYEVSWERAQQIRATGYAKIIKKIGDL